MAIKKRVSVAPSTSKRAAPAARSSGPTSRGASRGAPRPPVKTSKPARGKAPQARATKKRATQTVETAAPIKEAMTKTEMFAMLAEQSGVEVRDVKKVYGALVDAIAGSLSPRGVGSFNLYGIAKLIGKKIPAQKGGQKRISPFTGEEIITKPKPARWRIKARVLANIKKLAVGNPQGNL